MKEPKNPRIRAGTGEIQGCEFQPCEIRREGRESWGESTADFSADSPLDSPANESAESANGFAKGFGEKCAVVGVFNSPRSAALCYYALFAMQHRGQESSGISTSNGQNIATIKGEGLVTGVFKGGTERLTGRASIGHNRYSTAGDDSKCDTQPLFARYSLGQIAIAHNGNLTNAAQLRESLIEQGAIFQSHLDTENLIHLIAKSQKSRLKDRIVEALHQVEGAFSFVFLSRGKLFAVRDRFGFRPLSLGEITNEDGSKGYIVASESCAFDLINARFIRDINPGEMLIFSLQKGGESGAKSSGESCGNCVGGGESAAESHAESCGESRAQNPGESSNLHAAKTPAKAPQSPTVAAFESVQVFPPTPKRCIFEFVYFARPDSLVFGKCVYEIRKNMGIELAREHRIAADFVIPVPDSGVIAAIGYAQESKIPFEFGIVRNHYIGRTFIEPTQQSRELKVRLKLNPIEGLIKGRDIVVIDDSIVRGTTSRQIIKILRKAGARKIHLIIASPKTIAPCYYGVDTPDKSQLICATKSTEEVRDFVGADSLGFLSLEGLYRAVGTEQGWDYCKACFDGEYVL